MASLPKYVTAVSTALLGLTACSPLGAFNALAPHDDGAERRADGVAYGPEQRHMLDVYSPAGATGPSPVVVFIYGGGWDAGERGHYAFVGKALASQGFTTVIPDYRLVPQIHYPAFLEDNAKAVAWTWKHIAEYGGDPRRIFLAGHSAGAYNAVMVALAEEFLREEGAPPALVRGVAGLSGPYDFLPLQFDATCNAFGQVSDSDLPATQPVNRVGADVPPMFLATGTDDETVLPKHTASLAQALESAGAVVEIRRYDGLGHAGMLLALSRPLRFKAPVLDQMVRFFRRQAPLN